MKRDMMKTVAEVKGKIPSHYSMKCDELLQLGKIIIEGGDANAVYDVIMIAFNYGFVLGTRSEKNKKRKKQKAPVKRPGQSIAGATLDH